MKESDKYKMMTAISEQVIIQQPGTQNSEQPPPYTLPNAWMPSGGYQPLNTICPPGLEYLIPLDRIFLHHNVRPSEVNIPVMRGVNGSIDTVLDGQGRILYGILEESDCLSHLCVGSLRNFKMSLYDRYDQVALLIERSTTCFADRMNIFNGSKKIGSIKENPCSFLKEYRVFDENEHEILRVSLSKCMCTCELEYTIFNVNGNDIGMIKRKWSGDMQVLFTDDDIYGVNFPIDLCVKAKAALLAVTILIDLVYHENH